MRTRHPFKPKPSLVLQGKDVIGQSETGSGKTPLSRFRSWKGSSSVLGGFRPGPLPDPRALHPVAREMRKLGRRHAGFNSILSAAFRWVRSWMPSKKAFTSSSELRAAFSIYSCEASSSFEPENFRAG